MRFLLRTNSEWNQPSSRTTEFSQSVKIENTGTSSINLPVYLFFAFLAADPPFSVENVNLEIELSGSPGFGDLLVSIDCYKTFLGKAEQSRRLRVWECF